MKKRYKLILGGFGLMVLALALSLVFLNDGDSNSSKKNLGMDESDPSFETSAKHLFDDPEFADAPYPEDDELSQAEKLWPFALEKKPDRKEKVKEEWRDFAAKYPKNFYIPKEIRPPRTEAEEQQAQELLEDFTAMDASFASFISKNKWSEPGNNPPSAGPERPAPAKQRAYFDYKIYELESRIQMIEYWMENQASATEKVNADKDLKVWRKELSSLQEVRSQVPQT
ncbi:hypothetical protein [Leptospira ilyithenensis]|uniref:Uncharacterized protein n=1 Tax=Leptospira ilyithenensis TaxID=2484901 RepID=A0A4R9LN23_9LEPT|nr:hypothetical protein [Leptospira ilyithenensis]TGN10099.1 hypothetical protein EHS11_11100 [Leptospira ilyithenensis]